MCASKPEDRMRRSGRKASRAARMRGIASSSTHSVVTTFSAWWGAFKTPGWSGRALLPEPGKTSSPVACRDRYMKRGSKVLAKMSSVPLPWCTSKSKMRIFFWEWTLCACLAAAAMVPNKQKPIAPLGNA